MNFLYQLVELIKDRVKYTKMHLGTARISVWTLSERVCSCRDFAILLMETCRFVGIPSRFVSGYQFKDLLLEKYKLQAWTEVFIPGFDGVVLIQVDADLLIIITLPWLLLLLMLNW